MIRRRLRCPPTQKIPKVVVTALLPLPPSAARLPGTLSAQQDVGKQEHLQALPPNITPSSGLNPRTAGSMQGKEKHPRMGAAEVSCD